VRGRLGDDELILVKPTTYMNLSGEAVRKVLARERAPMRDFLVVVDDMALPLGRVRMKARGSAGGHNGLRSIIGEMDTEVFARLRVGIGSPSKGAIDHVLGDFASAEQKHLDLILDAATDAVELWTVEGPEAVADKWNGWRPDLGVEAAGAAVGQATSASKGAATSASKGDSSSDTATTPSPAQAAARQEPDADGVVRTSTGWRRLLPRALRRDGGDEPR
jgi:PTH1 family peptidyl-tRNA hydrolase